MENLNELPHQRLLDMQSKTMRELSRLSLRLANINSELALRAPEDRDAEIIRLWDEDGWIG